MYRKNQARPVGLPEKKRVLPKKIFVYKIFLIFTVPHKRSEYE